jgi:type I restriction enzyme, R subunit
MPPADISQVMEEVGGLLDKSISAEGYIIQQAVSTLGDEQWIDLSEINFEKLAEEFDKGRKKTLNEKLKGTVASKVMEMVRLNRTRMDYLEKFQAMIDAYNQGSMNAEEFFKQLKEFSRQLGQEEKRAMSENLSEEELALFDLLTKPDIELTETERRKVKATAKELLTTLKKEKLILDWRKRQQSRAMVRLTIEMVLDSGLPRAYTPRVI